MIHPEIVPHCYHYYFNTDLHPRLITSSWWQSLRIMIPNISDNQINAQTSNPTNKAILTEFLRVNDISVPPSNPFPWLIIHR